MRRITRTLASSLAATAIGSSAWAATRTWDNDSGDYLWSAASNWSSNLLPGSGDTAVINGLSTSVNPVLIAAGSPANPGTFIVGDSVGSNGFLSIQDSITFGFGTATPLVGNAGTGTVTQWAGTLAPGFGLTLGETATGIGNYTLSGGAVTPGSVNSIKIGNSGAGTFTQTGGSVTSAGDLILGNAATGAGAYAMSGSGTLWIKSSKQLAVGKLGTGTFTIAGNTVTGEGTGSNILVGVGSRIQGYGTFSYSNNASAAMITTNGRVIADGGGTDRTLSFVSGGAFGTTNQLTANTVENTTSNGWYAQNHGKLTLSKISTGTNGAGVKSVTFAESASDTTIDLVNSARFTFTVTGATNVLADVSLLAADRTDIAPAPANTSFIGIWSLAAGSLTGFSSPSYQFRYDDSAAAGRAPALYRLSGGTWQLLGSTNDLTNHILATTDSSITSFNNTFAIGVAIPEPATVGLLSTGTLLMLGRRRRP